MTMSQKNEQTPLLPTLNNNGNSNGNANGSASQHQPHDEQYDDPPQQDKRLCRILLIVVAFLYGTLNVSLRGLYAMAEPPSASVLSTARGWLAALTLAPLFWWEQRQQPKKQPSRDQEKDLVDTEEDTSSSITDNQPVSNNPNNNHQLRPLWLVALELAVLNFGAQGLSNVGLLFITGARAAFLAQTSVVMTPLLAAAVGHAVQPTVWWGCAAAMVGLLILSRKEEDSDKEDETTMTAIHDDSSSTTFGFGFGDALVLGGALSWALYIFRLSQCEAYNEVHLQSLKNILLACLYTIWFALAQWHSSELLWTGYGQIGAWLLLAYSAAGPGAIADVLQQKGQASIAAPEANVILAMEPLFTSLLGWVLLHEALTWPELVGGGFLVVAAILATR